MRSWPSLGLPCGVWVHQGQLFVRRPGALDRWSGERVITRQLGPDLWTMARVLSGDEGGLYSWRSLQGEAELLAMDLTLERRWSHRVPSPTARGLAAFGGGVAWLSPGLLQCWSREGALTRREATSAREVVSVGGRLVLGGAQGLWVEVDPQDVRGWQRVDPEPVGGLTPLGGGLLYRVAGETRLWSAKGSYRSEVTVEVGGPAIEVEGRVWAAGPPGAGVFGLTSVPADRVAEGKTALGLAACGPHPIALVGTGLDDLQLVDLDAPWRARFVPELSSHLAWDGSALWILGSRWTSRLAGGDWVTAAG